MEIKILGTGCPNCKTLENRVRKVITRNNIDARITKVEDIVDIMAYNVMATPALVIDEEVIVKGRVPSETELLRILLN
ncbi:MAG: TM0996/MTH895 family glutaredoxin-like protein [Bacteroidales bacterium]|nr:TM0996/MTH895 family glutaredoxin-like protein [Bacteroidales bacterium]